MSLDEIEKKLLSREEKKNITPRSKNRKIASSSVLRSADSPRKKDKFLDDFQRYKEMPRSEAMEEELVDSVKKEGVPHEEEYLKHARFLKRAFLGITLASGTIIALGIFFIFNSGSSNKEVSVSLILPNKIERGVPFDVSVEINNNGEALIENTRLKLSHSNGIVSLNDGGSLLISENIGNLGGGSLSKKTFRFLPVADEGEEENMTASLDYVVGGNARFEAEKTENITIKKSALNLEVKYPEKILGGSEFAININYENISDFDFPSVILSVAYPGAFRYASSDLRPDSLNNEWRLGELKANSKGSFQIKGVLDGPRDGKFSFPAVLFVEFLGKRHKVAEAGADLSVAEAPVFLDIALSGSEGRAVRLNEELRYSVRYQNMSSVVMQDVVIKTELSGEMFDFGSLESSGNFDSTRKTITWDVNNNPILRMLDPGASGEVSFVVRSKSQYPISRINDRNFSLRVSAELTSPSVPPNISASKTRVVDDLTSKIAGMITVDARGLFRDAISGIANSGPFPPQVDLPSRYTVHWVLRNYSTDMGNLTIRAGLPLGVSWVGETRVNFASSPVYMADSREVVWSISKLPATKGVLGEPAEAVFQIEATPSLGYVGAYFPILGETALDAVDDFTGLSVTARDGALTTDLVDDPTVSRENGRVVP